MYFWNPTNSFMTSVHTSQIYCTKINLVTVFVLPCLMCIGQISILLLDEQTLFGAHLVWYKVLNLRGILGLIFLFTIWHTNSDISEAVTSSNCRIHSFRCTRQTPRIPMGSLVMDKGNSVRFGHGVKHTHTFFNTKITAGLNIKNWKILPLK